MPTPWLLWPLVGILLLPLCRAVPLVPSPASPASRPAGSEVVRRAAVPAGCILDELLQTMDNQTTEAQSYCDDMLGNKPVAVPSFIQTYSPDKIWSACFCLPTESTPPPSPVNGPAPVAAAPTQPAGASNASSASVAAGLPASYEIISSNPGSAPMNVTNATVEILPNQPGNGSIMVNGSGTDSSYSDPSELPKVALTSGGIDCMDPKRDGLDSECWKVLNLTSFVKRWVREHECKADQPFATCFLDAHDLVGWDCNQIDTDSCSTPPFNYDPQTFYVIYTIYGVHQFFNSYWLALVAANGLASEALQAIVNMIAPPKTKNLEIQGIFTALTYSLALLDIPAAFALVGMRALVADTMLTAVQQAPAMLKYFFPVQNVDPATVQIYEISNQLAQLVNQFQGTVSSTIGVINSNATVFMAWAETGLFSSGRPSLEITTGHLYQGLNTYVISQAYAANNIIGARALDTNVQQLQANSSSTLSYDIHCAAYDQYNTCNAWWYDESNHITYTLDSLEDASRNPYSDLQTMFSNAWTTGPLLFGGASKCKGSSGYQKSPTLSNQGGLSFDCISTLQMCTWDLHCGLSTTCEFSDCPVQESFAVNSCSHAEDAIYSVTVPAGYMGSYLTDANPLSTVCNDGAQGQ
ncbi:MAG: hypothetical protein M1838_001744 [Thelocarpon superellum]|nr:MAG: hypothetical protein M1838_001744 [Thelocarpon superellum]